MVDTGNSGPVPAEDHISCGTLKVFSSMVIHQLPDEFQRSRLSKMLVCKSWPVGQGISNEARSVRGGQI